MTNSNTDTTTGTESGESDAAIGWEQMVWNRPAKVEAVYSDQAKVRFQDNGTLSYVPLDALAGGDR